MIDVDPVGELDVHPCDCCGADILVAKGWLSEGERDLGTYKVEWAEGQLEHESSIDLILGDWSEAGQASDRYAVSIVHRLHDGRPQFLVIDAAEKFLPQSDAYGRTMSRADLGEIGMTSTVHAYAEQIVLKDARLYDLTGGWAPERPQ
ncbi:MAG: hypothetical protein REJ23_04455 [Brevundimonas sp.]|nr:hypothetical protein [Brevundimonas sp.]